MNLDLFAEEMKQVAKQNPHNQERVWLAPEVCRREMELDGIKINVILTYNVWDSIPIAAWQLSISRSDRTGPLAEEQVQKLVGALLGTVDVIELTSMLPPAARPDIIRQFTCQVNND